MALNDDYQKLVGHLATLRAHKQALGKVRERLTDHAREQFDTAHPVVDGWTEANRSGQAGGILGHRRLRTALVERNRLAALVHADEVK